MHARVWCRLCVRARDLCVACARFFFAVSSVCVLYLYINYIISRGLMRARFFSLFLAFLFFRVSFAVWRARAREKFFTRGRARLGRLVRLGGPAGDSGVQGACVVPSRRPITHS